VRPSGLHGWLDLLVRLSRAQVVSIASIRGRARGAESELVLAYDLRFASRGTTCSAVRGRNGLVRGGGPMAWLARLTGRGRALDGPCAARHGYVNRAIADHELPPALAEFFELFRRPDA
jgi:enoyl-CoA hydratase/carnithine racemase